MYWCMQHGVHCEGCEDNSIGYALYMAHEVQREDCEDNSIGRA